MKYDLHSPCTRCPFRNDIRPFNEADRAHDILTAGHEFACHKTVDYEDDGEGKVLPNSQHCAGVLILLEKADAPHQMMRICERIGIYDRSKLRMDAPVYDTVGECVRAHKRR